MAPKMSDEEVYDALYAALVALGTGAGGTIRGNTAIEAARTMLTLLQLGLVKAMEDEGDRIEGITPPERSPHAPPD